MAAEATTEARSKRSERGNEGRPVRSRAGPQVAPSLISTRPHMDLEATLSKSSSSSGETDDPLTRWLAQFLASDAVRTQSDGVTKKATLERDAHFAAHVLEVLS